MISLLISAPMMLMITGSLLWLLTGVTQLTDTGKAQQALVQMLAGISYRNMSMIRRYATPNCLILEDGHLYNLNDVAKQLAGARRTAATRVNHLYFATTRINDSTAWLAFTDIADITEKGKTTSEHYLESAYLIKVNGVWKVRMIHSTTIATYVK